MHFSFINIKQVESKY